MASHTQIHTDTRKLCSGDIYLITGDWIPFCGIVLRFATHTPWYYQLAPVEVVELKCCSSQFPNETLNNPPLPYSLSI